MSTRRESREFTLQFLYHFQLPVFKDLKDSLRKDMDSAELFDRMVEFKHVMDIELAGEAQAYATTMIRGILQKIDELEETLVRYLKNWKLHRLSKIEHTLLLMSIWELKHQPETPYKVVINESIELAKKYSTKEAGPFVNGILDALVKAEIKA